MSSTPKDHTVLLISRGYRLAWVLPQLLARAGLTVDLISSTPFMQKSRLVRNCSIVPATAPLLPAIQKHLANPYDWIVLTEDAVILEVLQSPLSLEEKLKLLPVQKEEHFAHLFSKIGLSKALASHGLSTPPFRIASNLSQAHEAALELNYPVLLKIDQSCGGAGVFECQSLKDLSSLSVFDRPVLIQKKIEGVELDLSALYFKGELIHFSFSKVEKNCFKFGPSLLRGYQPLSSVEESIFKELAQIGKALGCHGFTNIGCIESKKKRFYIEVDMRPNVWIETPRYFGEDPAIRIKNWFLKKETLKYPVETSQNFPQEILIPYFLRLTPSKLLSNRYRVWKFIPRDDWKLVAIILLKTLFSVRSLALALVPKKYHSLLRRVKAKLRAFL